MSYGDFVRRAVTLLVMIVVTIIAFSALVQLRDILLTVFFCWVLSVGLNSLINRIQRFGVPRTPAVLTSLLIVVITLLLVAVIIIPPFISQARNLVESLPAAVESAIETYADLRSQYDIAEEILPEFDVEDYRNLLESENLAAIFNQESVSAVNVNNILNSAIPLLGGIGNAILNLIANLLIILIITGYLLADPLVYYRPIVAIMPKDREERVVDIINDIRANVTAWIGALTVSITITTIAVTVALGVILNIPNAFALGVISGLGALVPNLGYYIGLIPILIFTAAFDPVLVIPAAILYWIISQIEGNLITPQIMSRDLNLPAGILLPFQIIAAATLGFYGILLAVPMLAILTTIVRETYVYDILNKEGHSRELKQLSDGTIGLIPTEHSTDADDANKKAPPEPVTKGESDS